MSFKVVYVVMVTECSEWDHFIAKYVKLCSQWVAAVESGPRTCSLIITSVLLQGRSCKQICWPPGFDGLQRVGLDPGQHDHHPHGVVHVGQLQDV